MSLAEAPILEAIEISKNYGTRLALDNVSLAVRPGEIAGLLGPNGAGKTTTLSILATLLRPDHGRILINGKPPNTDRRGLGRMLGLVPQSLALYPTLSAAQNAWHFARMQGLSRDDATESCRRVLEEVGLRDRADDPMHAFSGGMKRLLNLACGIVHRPPVLLLDEPTVGVDLQSREQILTRIRHYADAGSAVIYSTHYMEEAERICDRVLLIDRGKLIAEGDLEKVISLGGGRPRIELTYRGQLPQGRFGRLAGVREIGAIGIEGRATLEMNSLAQVAEVLHGLRTLDVNVIDFNLHSPNLSDAFIALTGHTLRDQVL
ncbi:ABC transporter ATP-binding protein [Candidatus Binatus sp.]|uniref:ABC transporter ATP-binding protein n=1 Tax=Candidatus Binatus sp. TaxID=2811406 RepID=UPI002F9382B1